MLEGAADGTRCGGHRSDRASGDPGAGTADAYACQRLLWRVSRGDYDGHTDEAVGQPAAPRQVQRPVDSGAGTLNLLVRQLRQEESGWSAPLVRLRYGLAPSWLGLLLRAPEKPNLPPAADASSRFAGRASGSIPHIRHRAGPAWWRGVPAGRGSVLVSGRPERTTDQKIGDDHRPERRFWPATPAPPHAPSWCCRRESSPGAADSAQPPPRPWGRAEGRQHSGRDGSPELKLASGLAAGSVRSRGVSVGSGRRGQLLPCHASCPPPLAMAEVCRRGQTVVAPQGARARELVTPPTSARERGAFSQPLPSL